MNTAQNEIQIIYTGNQYEAADRSNSELPEWPVQDSGAHWHHEEFEGQRVIYRGGDVFFGFMAECIGETEDMSEEVLAGAVYCCEDGKTYRAV